MQWEMYWLNNLDIKLHFHCLQAIPISNYMKKDLITPLTGGIDKIYNKKGPMAGWTVTWFWVMRVSNADNKLTVLESGHWTTTMIFCRFSKSYAYCSPVVILLLLVTRLQRDSLSSPGFCVNSMVQPGSHTWLLVSSLFLLKHLCLLKSLGPDTM